MNILCRWSHRSVSEIISLKGPQTPKLTYHFPKRARSSENFDSNISTQQFVNTEIFAFEVEDLRKWCRKHAATI